MLAGWFARRYFFSKKSHSVINLIAGVSVVSVAVPVAAMIVLLSVFNGFEQLVRSMNSHFDADLTLTPREGQTFGIESLDTAALRRLPGVEAVSLALEQSALMEYRGRQAMVTVRGVADGYDRVVPVAECITAGDYAVRLPVEGYTRRQAEVAGVFAADAQTDGRYLFTSLRLAQELFSYPDRASAAVVRVARGARPAEVKRRVAEAAGGAFEVRTRDELNASFYTIMQYEKWGIFLISLLVLVIASFSIVGTVVMLVLDKRPEFVALGAMGADTRFVRRIFFFEGGLIGVLGAGAGVVLGVGLCLVQHYFGVIEIPADSFLVKSYPVLLRGGDVAAVVAAFAVVVGAMTAVTVRRAVRADDMAAGRTAQ